MGHPVTALCESIGASAPPVETFVSWPSPTRRLDALSRALGTSVWLKDDGNARAPYGGNKPRKLELLLAEAKAQGRESVVTIGELGSHQVLATAIYGRALAMPVHAIVFRSDRASAVTDRAIDNALHALSEGASFVPASLDSLQATTMELLELLGKGAYVVPTGGSTPLGNLGFAGAAFELKQQIDAGLLEPPDDIFIPLGTGGSAAGLAVGCALVGIQARIVGVRVAGEAAVSPVTVTRQMTALMGRLRARGAAKTLVEGPLPPVHFVDDQLGDGYGHATEGAVKAVALAEELEGLKLETVYSGKAMAAVLAAAAAGATQARGRKILFWQTSNTVSLAPPDVALLGPRLHAIMSQL